MGFGSIADVSDLSTGIPSHFAILRPRNPHCQGTDNQSYGLRRRRFKRQRNGLVGRIALASTNFRDFPRSRSRRRIADANLRSCEVRPDLIQLGPISIAFARSQRPNAKSGKRLFPGMSNKRSLPRTIRYTWRRCPKRC